MGKIDQTTAQHNQVQIMCIFLSVYQKDPIFFTCSCLYSYMKLRDIVDISHTRLSTNITNKH